jgi:hypothetical protein
MDIIGCKDECICKGEQYDNCDMSNKQQGHCAKEGEGVMRYSRVLEELLNPTVSNSSIITIDSTLFTSSHATITFAIDHINPTTLTQLVSLSQLVTSPHTTN